MCGIWGLFGDENNIIDINNFWKIQHRGPDYSCIQKYDKSLIGFHRLSIIDESFMSNQPFIARHKTKTIVFVCNGEIYNYKELQKNYNLNKHNNSDCHVILELYMTLNIDLWKKLFINEIKGEFAFILAIYDENNKFESVLIARDQLGVRSLYYTPMKHKILQISSELKGFTVFNNVSEYPPGVISTYDKNINFSTYSFRWIYDIMPNHMNTTDTYLSNIKNAVIKSVKRRLISDKPIAFLLSGGVDSSLVCAIASQLLGRQIDTFCCGMEGSTDLHYARIAAKHINSNHHELIYTPNEGIDAIDSTIRTIESWDTTTVRASVGQYLISKYISTNFDHKVVMVGEGPDEVCSSYLFNWYAPSSEELDKCSKEYVKNIHMYDVKRVDKCVSNWGLEARVPLLDPEFIKSYWELPHEVRHPNYKGIEKWWLRKAFDGINLLPDEILWRKKEAFSDGVSSKANSWYGIIQKHIEPLVSLEYVDNYMLTHCPVQNKEAIMYKYIFNFHYPQALHIIPSYWNPKWNKDKNEIRTYIDPSARELDIYVKDTVL